MRHSETQIRTSHVGSLPRPDELIAANRAREGSEGADDAAFQLLLRASVEDIVRRYPDQFLWTHRRYRTRPRGMPPVYDI